MSSASSDRVACAARARIRSGHRGHARRDPPRGRDGRATIVDGGNVLAQQRVAQNGVDATAEAGAVLLAERLAGAAQPSGGWDLNIAGRMTQTAAANNMTVEAAYYTDICGIPLKLDGTGAIFVNRTEDLATRPVGRQCLARAARAAPRPRPTARTGSSVRWPACSSSPARTSAPTSPARSASRSFTVNTRATAVAGYLQGYCDATRGQVLRAAARSPSRSIRSRATGRTTRSTPATPWTFNVVYKIPLCAATARQRRLPRLDPAGRRHGRGRVLDPDRGQPGDRPAVVAVRPCGRQHERRRRRVQHVDRGRDSDLRRPGRAGPAVRPDVQPDQRRRTRIAQPAGDRHRTELRLSDRRPRRQRHEPVVSHAELRLPRAVRPDGSRLQRPARRLHLGQQQRRVRYRQRRDGVPRRRGSSTSWRRARSVPASARAPATRRSGSS